MAKRSAAPTIDLDSYGSLRAQVQRRLAHLTLEQRRLQDVLALLPLEGDEESAIPSARLVPDPGPERIPAPRRRSWSPEAREAQRKRMKAHWRKKRSS